MNPNSPTVSATLRGDLKMVFQKLNGAVRAQMILIYYHNIWLCLCHTTTALEAVIGASQGEILTDSVMALELPRCLGQQCSKQVALRTVEVHIDHYDPSVHY